MQQRGAVGGMAGGSNGFSGPAMGLLGLSTFFSFLFD
jgi:hypothetical protein